MSARDVIARYDDNLADGYGHIDAILSALTAAGYRVVREGELDAARQALIQQRAFIRHWIDDVNGGLKPTVGSLRAASDMVDAALRALAGEAK